MEAGRGTETNRLSKAMAAENNANDIVRSPKRPRLSKDEEETPETRNTVILNESAKISRISDQERYEILKAKVKEFKEENHRLRRKMLDEAEIALQLREENKILLNELKKKCGPDIISFLEANNPDKGT